MRFTHYLVAEYLGLTREVSMRFPAVSLAFVAAILTVAPGTSAQEPVRDFSQLNTRLKPGDTVWVTDAQGREIKGKIRGSRRPR